MNLDPHAYDHRGHLFRGRDLDHLADRLCHVLHEVENYNARGLDPGIKN